MKPTGANRTLPRTAEFFIQGAAVADEHIAAIEDVKQEPGQLKIRPLIVGEDMLFLQAFKGKGMKDPMHQHDDHESIGYLIKGRMRLVIDGKEFIAVPGDAWLHPAGVPHFSEALEDCLQVEVKSPPRKTWVAGG